MKVKKIRKDGWVGREVYRVKEYRTVGGFVKGVRLAISETMGFWEDMLSIVVTPDHVGHWKDEYGIFRTLILDNDAVRDWKKSGKAMTLEELIRKYGAVSYTEGGNDWKQGFDVDFSSGRIYVFDMWKEE